MSRLLIRNGRVVDPSQGLDQGMDVLLEDGVVAALDERVQPPSDTPVIDAAELVVAPGFIDARVDLGEPGFEHRETIESGCRAAVAGGFAAVCCVAGTEPVNDDPAVTRFIVERAADVGLAHVYPIGALSEGEKGEQLAEIGEMVREGAVAVGDDRQGVRNALLMRRALEYARSFRVPVVSQPIDADLASAGLVHEGAVSTRIGMRGLPAAAETVIVARDLELAELTGGRLHLGPLSTAASLEFVRQAKGRGADVSCDVAAHHFSLSDEDVATCNYDPNWKVMPPLRPAADVEAVLQGLYDGTVDMIVSDHAPRHADEKDLDFALAPFGIVGLETAVSLAVDRLIHGRVLGIGQLVRLFATRPAQVFDLPGGTLKLGAPADLTLLDLRTRRKIDPKGFASRSRNTPFGGSELRGGPVTTIVGGRVVWSLVSTPGHR